MIDKSNPNPGCYVTLELGSDRQLHRSEPTISSLQLENVHEIHHT